MSVLLLGLLAHGGARLSPCHLPAAVPEEGSALRRWEGNSQQTDAGLWCFRAETHSGNSHDSDEEPLKESRLKEAFL